MEKEIIFKNWYKYSKAEWLTDMRRALVDIETNNGENFEEILENYFE